MDWTDRHCRYFLRLIAPHARLYTDLVDGVTLGRVAYHHPYLLAQLDALCFGGSFRVRPRAEIVEALIPYAQAELARGVSLRAIVRHLLGLYHGAPGARTWPRNHHHR